MGVLASGDGHLPFDVVPGLADGAKLLGVLIGDLHPVLFLEGHDQLDQVKGVGLQVVGEGRFRGHLLDVDAKLLRDDAAELVEIRFGHPSLLLGIGIASTVSCPNLVYTIANRDREREYPGWLAGDVSREAALGYGPVARKRNHAQSRT